MGSGTSSPGKAPGPNSRATHRKKQTPLRNESMQVAEVSKTNETLAKSVVDKSDDELLEHSALIIDCGAKETRAIRIEFSESGGGTLSLETQSVAPPIVSFLGRPGPVTISDTKLFQDMVENAEKEDKPEPEITKYFLETKDKVKHDYVIHENDFVAWVLEQKEKRHANTVVLGSSGWYRNASGADLEKANKVLKQLGKIGVRCVKLERKEESVYEAASVSYAAHAIGTGQIHAVIDVTGDHVKYMCGMKSLVKLHCGWDLGQHAMQIEYQKVNSAQAALKVADDYVNSKMITNRVRGRVGYEINQALEAEHTDMQDKRGNFVKQLGNVVCIAAMGDVFVGDDQREFANPLPVAKCLSRMRKQVNDLEADANKNPAVFFSSRATRTLVKLKLQIKLFETFFDLHKTKLLFKRDWELPGGVRFCATWAAGWYMHYLQRLAHIAFDGAKDVLAVLNNIPSVSSQAQHRLKVAEYDSFVKNLKVVMQATTGFEVMTEHSALIFDCGSGETKAILITFEHGSVRVEQICKVPAVLSFLGSPKPFTIAETKPFRDLQKKAKKYGQPAPPTTKYFLKHNEPVHKDYTINETDFVRWVLEQQEKINADYVLVESSNWHRAGLGSAVEQLADGLVETLKKNGLFCKKLGHEEEALFEAASVSYAASALSWGATKSPDALMTAGGASAKYILDMRTVVALDCGFREGQNAMKHAYGETKDIEAALQAVDAFIDNVVVGREIKKATDLCLELGLADIKGQIVKQQGTAICIGCCYYAAKAAGIGNEDDEVNAISMSECVKAFNIAVAEQQANARKNPEEFMAGRGSMTLVNLKIQIKLLETFFGSDAQLIFKRDWLLPGKTIFRTTWSSGWYLQKLQELGIYFSGSEAVQKILDQERPLSEDNALVIDCGSGETKAMFLEYTNTGRNQSINMKQLSVSPAVLSFLESPKPFTIAETKPFHDLLREAQQKGNPPPITSKYFMKHPKPVDNDYTINADDFVDWVLEQRSHHKAKRVIIGTSGWHRVADADLRVSEAADALVHRLKRLDIKNKMLIHKEEAYYEAASVSYAASVLGISVDAVLGSGGGSVQYMYRMRTAMGLNCGFREGQNAMKEAYNKTRDIEAALQAAEDYVNGDCLHADEDNANDAKTLSAVTGRLGKEIKEAIARVQVQKLCDTVGEIIMERGTVVCISSCYYAAKAAGIANKDDEVKAISMPECVQKFKAAEIKLEANARENPEEFMRGQGTMTLVNLKIQIKLFETFFDSTAQIIFKRDWLLPGNVPFRTTWTAGYYLSTLQKKGVSLPGKNKILGSLKKFQDSSRRLLRKRSRTFSNLMNVDVNNLGMVLVSFEDAVAHIQKLARRCGKEVTPILQEIARKYHGHMEGLHHHIKGDESLLRKLISKVVLMTKEHIDNHAFSPNLFACIASIHDALRYTIVFPPKYYTAGVMAIEDALLDGIGNDRFSCEGIAKKFTAKNSWKSKDNQTTYMGVNVQVTLKSLTSSDPSQNGKPIAMSENYVFELQLHTPGSFKLKGNDSHLFYEALRDEEYTKGTIPPLKKHEKYPKNAKLLDGIDFDIALYKSLKSMWNTNDEHGSPKVPGRKYLGVKFQPFKPKDMSIVTYSGRYTRKFLAAFERKQRFSQNTNAGLYNSDWFPQNKLIEKYEKLMSQKT